MATRSGEALFDDIKTVSEIGVFQNTCRHRGMILVDTPRKIGGAIRCPYHSWCYSLKGKLHATPHVGGPGQNKHEDIDKASVDDGELWLINSYIAPYEQAKVFKHEERRRRKLLVSRKELSNLWNATQRKGMTLVPLVLYFNHRGMAKVKIGVAKGKRAPDKREATAKRDWNRQKQRLLKDHG